MTNKLSEALRENGFLKQSLSVTLHDYRDAVNALLELALDDTSGSRAAAQVLLSTYKGNNYHVDLTDLCVFDYRYLEMALIVIKGRVMLNVSPCDSVPDGVNRFKDLELSWAQLRTSVRYI